MIIVSLAAAAALAGPPAPVPFPVHVTGSTVLVTAHPVHAGERLVIRGVPFTVASADHPGVSYTVRVKGGLLRSSWRDRTLAAVDEG